MHVLSALELELGAPAVQRFGRSRPLLASLLAAQGVQVQAALTLLASLIQLVSPHSQHMAHAKQHAAFCAVSIGAQLKSMVQHTGSAPLFTPASCVTVVVQVQLE